MEQPAYTRPDLFERSSRWAGDLDHPFYDDERNRWVWYEASAIGFQIALFGSYLAGGVALLVGGIELLPWVLLMMAPAILGGSAVFIHARRHSAEYATTLQDLRSSRGIAALGAILFFAVSVVVAGLDGSPLIVVGVLAFFGAGVSAEVGIRRRRADAHVEALDDD